MSILESLLNQTIKLSSVRQLARKLKYWRQRDLRGCFDGLRGSTVAGWAENMSKPGERVAVELFEGRKRIVGTEAAIYRADLKLAGIGDGRHGFEIVVPQKLIDGRPHTLTLRVGRRWNLTPGGFMFREQPVEVPPNLLDSSDPLSDETPVDLWNVVKTRFPRIDPLLECPRLPLVFPVHETPDVSIVMPVHNKFPVTIHGLASLLNVPSRLTYEVILVDDGSSDETLQVCDRVQGITLVRHESALGFVHSCNDGAAVARGRYVVMLNNDIEVTRNWLDELIWPFEHLDRVGLVGAQLIYPDRRLQESGGIVWRSGAPWNYGRGANPMAPRYNYTRDVDYASGACIALTKHLWDQLGGFDPEFAPAYYEDTDLAFRVRKAGFRTLVAPLSKVFHFEGLSSGTDLSAGMKRFQVINQPKFRARWQKEFETFGSDAVEPDKEKDRGVRLRALVLDAENPTPDINAGSYAAIQEMRLLQSLGFKITFAPKNMLHGEAYTEALQRQGIECLYTPFWRSFREILERRGREFDLVYITRYYVAEKILESIRELAPQARIILNNADLHFLREIRMAMASGDSDLMEAAKATREAELAVMKKVDLVLSYNEVEHAIIQSHNLNETKVALCPWVVEISENSPPFEARRDIAFLGGYGHAPNVQAVEYFVADVMPLLRQRLPGVRFLVYGSKVPDSMRALDCEDVVIKGYVNDTAEVYDSCRVFVAPLRSGAGLKGKVVAALAAGVPCVLSPVAAEGTGVREGIEGFIAFNPLDWVWAIAELYEKGEIWSRVSTASKKHAEDRFSFRCGMDVMQRGLEVVGLNAGQSIERTRTLNLGENANGR